MKKFKKIILTTTILIAAMIFTGAGEVQAALQANGGTAATKAIDTWILQVRQMETSGGTLGLSETINTSGLLNTTTSNGLDCHMEKNTEYGAMIILSASAYGNSNKIASGETTTGNKTGIVMNINSEWVAAAAGMTNSTYFKGANAKYKNNDYGTTTGAKYHTGDAMDIGGWHGGTGNNWLSNTRDVAFLRAVSGSIFSYLGYSANTSGATYIGQPHPTRAVVVIGEGF